MTTCPACHGEGRLPYQEPGGCICCGGAGEITVKRATLLAEIRRDLAARIVARGWT